MGRAIVRGMQFIMTLSNECEGNQKLTLNDLPRSSQKLAEGESNG